MLKMLKEVSFNYCFIRLLCNWGVRLVNLLQATEVKPVPKVQTDSLKFAPETHSTTWHDKQIASLKVSVICKARRGTKRTSPKFILGETFALYSRSQNLEHSLLMTQTYSRFDSSIKKEKDILSSKRLSFCLHDPNAVNRITNQLLRISFGHSWLFCGRTASRLTFIRSIKKNTYL